MAHPIKFVGKRPQARRQRRILLARRTRWHPGLVVVSRLLEREAPLITKLDLADGLCAKGTVNLARRRVALFGGAVVLYAAAVADEVVARGLAVAIVGGAELDDAVALVFGGALDRGHEVLEASKNALGRGKE